MNMRDQLIIKIAQINDELLSQYLSKFVVHFEEPKEECCNKFCIRDSGRYCKNCPNHPMRNSNNTYKEEVIKLLNNLLFRKDYHEFLVALSSHSYPVPTVPELENLLQLAYEI